MDSVSAQGRDTTTDTRAWPFLAWPTGLALLLVLLAYWPSVAGMVRIWTVSETFAHGFLIAPISLWLIWRERHAIAETPVRPAPWGLLVILVLGGVWLLARLIGVNVVQQLAVVASLVAVVYTLLGWAMLKRLSFPLGFLFFAVPIGKELIPPLMDFTADFTVFMIELTGIPVYREGTFFELPTGNWSVVEGCSGVRYLIASVSLGTLYAYLTYRSLAKRLVFVLVAIVMPILANGLRAFMIVMIAHFSDMKLALGVDHFIYGWVFFGLVIFIMFYVGSFWRDEFPAHSPDPDRVARLSPAQKPAYLWLTALVALALLPWPWLESRAVEPVAGEATTVRLELPEAKGWRKRGESLTQWRPTYHGATLEIEQTYTKDNAVVSLYLAYYARQGEGAELINDANVLIPEKHPVWQQKKRGKRILRLGGEPLEVATALLRSPAQSLYVVHWYWVGGEMTANPVLAKLYQAKHTLFGGDSAAAALVIAAEMDEDPRPAVVAIQQFVDDMLPAIAQSLRTREAHD